MIGGDAPYSVKQLVHKMMASGIAHQTPEVTPDILD